MTNRSWLLPCSKCNKIWVKVSLPTRVEYRKIAYYGKDATEETKPIEYVEPVHVVTGRVICKECENGKSRKPKV